MIDVNYVTGLFQYRMRPLNKLFVLFCFCLFTIACKKQDTVQVDTAKQDAIIEKYLKKGAWNHHYLTKEWDEWIAKGIQEDSTIAYLWQQRALPLWKQQKYQVAISYFDKAVAIDREHWLSRLAFLKCIFAKDYPGALADIIAYKKEFGSTVEQDHTLELYMGICYLQLHRFDDALAILKENIQTQEREHSMDWIHFLDRYYLAMTHYEKNDYAMAIAELDEVLQEYPTFSDAQYYKSICLNYLGEKEKAQTLMAEAINNFEKGNTFNEDSNLYENYPYQVTWQWKSAYSML